MCKNIYLAGLCKTIGELYARKNHAQTPTHMQVQESPWVRQRVGPCQGESLPVPQGWIPLYTRDSRKGSETPRMAVVISGTGRVLADMELAPRAIHGAQQLSGTTAYAHQRVLESSSFAQLRAQVGATSICPCREDVSHLLPLHEPSHLAGHCAGSEKGSAPLFEQPGSPSQSALLSARSSMAFYFMKVYFFSLYCQYVSFFPQRGWWLFF